MQIPPPSFFFSLSLSPSRVLFASDKSRPFSDLPSCDRQVSFFCLSEPRLPPMELSLSPLKLRPASSLGLPPALPSPLPHSLLSLTTQSRNLLIPSGAMSSCCGLTPVPGCPSMAQCAVTEPEMFLLGWPQDEIITGISGRWEIPGMST